jgi:hypothetical protein
MRQVREVLRLRTAGVGLNEIARRVGVAPSTVRLMLNRLATAGLSWPLPAAMTDSALETALFAAAGRREWFGPKGTRLRSPGKGTMVFPLFDGRLRLEFEEPQTWHETFRRPEPGAVRLSIERSDNERRSH